MSAPGVQVLLAALSHAAQLAGGRLEAEQGRTKLLALEAQLAHQARLKATEVELQRDKLGLERHRLDLQASLAKDIIHALVEKRVDALQTAFMTLSASFADQARHYMAQQEKLAEGVCQAADSVQRASFQDRLEQTDTQLGQIRRDWHRLFRAYSTAVQQLGGALPSMRLMDGQALRLSGGGYGN